MSTWKTKVAVVAALTALIAGAMLATGPGDGWSAERGAGQGTTGAVR